MLNNKFNRHDTIRRISINFVTNYAWASELQSSCLPHQGGPKLIIVNYVRYKHKNNKVFAGTAVLFQFIGVKMMLVCQRIE